MAYTIPSVDDFKAQFPRDFPYGVPSFGAVALAIVAAGAVTGFSVQAPGQGYSSAPQVVLTNAPGDTGVGAAGTATVDNGGVTGIALSSPGSGYSLPPIVSFVNGSGDPTNRKRILDSDIAGGIFDAQFNINEGLFANQKMFTRAFLYLAAHQMIEKIKMAAGGVQSQYSWLLVDKTVGDVSAGYEIPAIVKENPFLASISTTRYGAMYLQIIAPLLVGNVMVDVTFTNP